MGSKVKIILADDHEVFLDGMLQAFKGHPDYEIIAVFKNGEQLLRGVKIYRPDLVLTDIIMPVLSGIDAISALKKDFPELLSIVLSNYDSVHLILNALDAGAFSYVNKAMPKEEIFAAIDSTLKEIPYYCKSTSQRILRLIANNQYGSPVKRTDLFNECEKKIIALYARDKLVKEIAAELFLGDRTVERYKAKIMEKMGVRTTAGIVVYAIKNKLIILDDSGGREFGLGLLMQKIALGIFEIL